MLLCLFADIKKCNIPLGFWLAGVFFFVIVETFLAEMRDRMNSNLYWDTRRRLKKWIVGLSGIAKEVGDMAWQIWGATMYFSSESDGCSEENWGFMFMMVFFIVYAAIKIVALCIVLSVLGYFGFLRQR